MSRCFKVACIQVTSGPDIAENVAAADRWIAEAVGRGASFVCLPENVAMMEPDRDKIAGRAVAEERHVGLNGFKATAQKYGIWLSVGSLAISLGDGQVVNRSYLLGPTGDVAARYDKIHLFDVNLANGESYRESDTFAAGNRAVAVDLPWGRLGLTICYDLRFPALYRTLALEGADFFTVPSAFTRQTGAAHWEVLLRARAIETGCYVFAAAQCGDHVGGRQTHGHSLVVSPWGEVLADGGDEPGIIVAEVDTNAVADARRKIPSLKSGAQWV